LIRWKPGNKGCPSARQFTQTTLGTDVSTRQAIISIAESDFHIGDWLHIGETEKRLPCLSEQLDCRFATS
jgi:hypothetical protein